MADNPRPVVDSGRVALVVDCDRTLTCADMGTESLVRVARRGLWPFLQLMWWMLSGRAAVKTRLARLDPVDAARLPLHAPVVALIDEARAAGRPVILASAGHRRNLSRVARAHGPFDALIGSNGRHNAKGAAKLAAIRAHLGDAPFDYVGDSAADRAIWPAARTAYTVGVATGHANEVRLAKPASAARALLKAMRPHQWAKNALVFVPLLTAGLALDPAAIIKACIAFAALSLLASGVYLVNDLLDIDADRAHVKKSRRPLASGALTIPQAIVAAALLTIVAVAATWFWLGWPATLALAAYLALTLAYSFWIKAIMVADVVMLALLYTIRLVVGAAAIMVAISTWLLLFSIFFFLGLAFLKRYIELSQSNAPAHAMLGGRGYVGSDADIVAISGIAAGMVSLLVVALFAEAMRGTGQYASPQLLWLLILPLLYWQSRVWMMARRGEVDGDPVAFAIKDRRSIALGVVMVGIVGAAKFLSVPGMVG